MDNEALQTMLLSGTGAILEGALALFAALADQAIDATELSEEEQDAWRLIAEAEVVAARRLIAEEIHSAPVVRYGSMRPPVRHAVAMPAACGQPLCDRAI